ncbi:MAG: hypothetical protein JSS66_00155 [Armatimonadetes bacterium]|nr:hypothetical protein [Armatimonadota bacterium]
MENSTSETKVTNLQFSDFWKEDPIHPDGEKTGDDRSTKDDNVEMSGDPESPANGDNESEDEETTEDSDDQLTLEPDTELEQQIKDPQVLKRLQDRHRGLDKLVERNKQKQAELDEKSERYQVFETYDAAFKDKDHVGPALKHMIEQLAKFHGVTSEDLIGSPTQGETTATATDRKFEYETDRAVYEAAREDAIKHIESTYGLKDLQSERQARSQGQAVEAAVQRHFEVTARKIAAKEAGWKLTKEAFRQAVKNNPGLQPEAAVRLEFYDDLKKHHSQLVNRSAYRPQDMAEPIQKKEKPRVDPRYARFSDFLS